MRCRLATALDDRRNDNGGGHHDVSCKTRTQLQTTRCRILESTSELTYGELVTASDLSGIVWRVPWRRKMLVTKAEYAGLTPKERIELDTAVRHYRLQFANTLALALGLLCTAGGLVFTAQSINTSREDTEVARQGQIADRYIKVSTQLASKNLSTRIAAVYAMEQIVQDSPAACAAVTDVLASF